MPGIGKRALREDGHKMGRRSRGQLPLDRPKIGASLGPHFPIGIRQGRGPLHRVVPVLYFLDIREEYPFRTISPPHILDDDNIAFSGGIIRKR